MERILVRFESREHKIDALRSVTLSDEPGAKAKFSFSQPNVLNTPATDKIRARFEAAGAKIYEDVKFDVLPPIGEGGDKYFEPGINGSSAYTMKDVIEQVNAPGAWKHTKGSGATIAVVDTGINGEASDIGQARRSPIDLPTANEGQHWNDTEGHGSMCATIAASAVADGGRYDGVAPQAKVLSARSNLLSSDLLDIYDELIRARSEGRLDKPLVVSNSYGLYVCESPQVLPEDHPYMGAIIAAVESGIFVCFAAGNNHFDVKCMHDPAACSPNTIWGPNSHDRVVSVGTVNRDLTNCDPATPHANSSRGPGEWAKETRKPDCVAPTYGEVRWGDSYEQMEWWGTSGACPQVAGLAALILSVAPDLMPAEVAELIKVTCSSLPLGPNCVGHGVIDCAKAVDEALKYAVG